MVYHKVFFIVYVVFEFKNALRMLKILFGLENKNIKLLKKNEVLIKKRVYGRTDLKSSRET